MPADPLTPVRALEAQWCIEADTRIQLRWPRYSAETQQAFRRCAGELAAALQQMEGAQDKEPTPPRCPAVDPIAGKVACVLPMGHHFPLHTNGRTSWSAEAKDDWPAWPTGNAEVPDAKD